MPYISTTNNQSYVIDTGDESQQREITIDGQALQIDWSQLAPLTADAKGQIVTGRCAGDCSRGVISPVNIKRQCPETFRLYLLCPYFFHLHELFAAAVLPNHPVFLAV